MTGGCIYVVQGVCPLPPHVPRDRRLSWQVRKRRALSSRDFGQVCFQNRKYIQGSPRPKCAAFLYIIGVIRSIVAETVSSSHFICTYIDIRISGGLAVSALQKAEKVLKGKDV